MYLVLFIIFIVIFCFLIIPIPGNIAANRGITGSELTTIRILSWCGLFWGITWFIALGLALIWKPEKWISDKDSKFEELEKAHKLMKNGGITKQEYEKIKKELL